MTVPSPTLNYESPDSQNKPRVSRLAVGLVIYIPLAIIIIFVVLPVFAFARNRSGGFRFHSLPAFTTGTFIPLLLGSIVILGIAFVALQRIQKSSGRLLGIGWAWSGIAFWSIVTIALFSAHCVEWHTERTNAITYNVCEGGGWLHYAVYDAISFTGNIGYPSIASPPGCDYLVSGLTVPNSTSIPAGLIILVQHDAAFNGSRWVAFADGTSRNISRSDFPAMWAANNAARVALGLAPLPMP